MAKKLGSNFHILFPHEMLVFVVSGMVMGRVGTGWGDQKSNDNRHSK